MAHLHQNHPEFDFFSSTTSVENSLRAIAAQRLNISIKELGIMAGAAVLDQYRLAAAEKVTRWWDPSLGLNACYAAITTAAPALALGAGAAIDVAIFGGASTDLTAVNPLYIALGAGSLVFAVGMGISKEHKNLLLVAMLTAAVGASVIAADDPAFKAHFASMLPAWLNQTSDLGTAKREIAEARVRSLEKLLQEHRTQLNSGGAGGKHMLDDGQRNNDQLAMDLAKVTIPMDESDLSKARENLASASSEQLVQNRENPAQFWGRILGAFYLFAWLAASQLAVASVIEKAPSLYREQRQRTLRTITKEKFVFDLENPNTEKSSVLVSASVNIALTRFNEILTLAAANDQEKLNAIGTLFREGMDEMNKIGSTMVCETLMPRHRSIFRRGTGSSPHI